MIFANSDRQTSRIIYLRDLIRTLIGREITLRYKRSLLGMAWSLLNPLAQLLVFHFVFSLVFPLDVPHYASFLFIGLLAWNWFQTSLQAATGAIVDNRELVRRPGFPVAVLPVISVSANLVHFLLAQPILLVFLILNGLSLSPAILLLPLLFTVQFLLTLSLAYFVATFHVPFRDTQYLLGIALLLGFYLSPVFYPASAIPLKYQGFYRLNPMVTLIEAYRSILLENRLPDPWPLLILIGASLVLLLVGYRFFQRASYSFAEEL